jgi:hypothetical protein
VRLSLVIPAFNEGERLHDGVARLRKAIDSGNIDPKTTEFVVVDDGSTDDTVPRAASLFGDFPHLQIVRLPDNRGKGAAVRAGVAAAAAPMIAFADADMSIDPTQTSEFVRALNTFDVAIGSRAAEGASVDRPSIRRSVMNRAFNMLVNALTRVSLNDTQCGFKAFRAPIAKLLFHCSVTERFAFDVEILSLARRLNLSIEQVPVHWDRITGSRVRPWLDPGSMARDVFRASRRSASAPSVPALILDPRGIGSTGPDPVVVLKALQQELSPVLPYCNQGDGRVLVLCPLMSEEQIVATSESMSLHVPDGGLERSTLSVAQLVAMAPFSLEWDA